MRCDTTIHTQCVAVYAPGDPRWGPIHFVWEVTVDGRVCTRSLGCLGSWWSTCLCAAQASKIHPCKVRHMHPVCVLLSGVYIHIRLPVRHVMCIQCISHRKWVICYISHDMANDTGKADDAAVRTHGEDEPAVPCHAQLRQHLQQLPPCSKK